MKYLIIVVLVASAVLCAPEARAELDILTQADEGEVIIGVKYTKSYFREFLWGLSRPFHFYNTQPDGTRVMFPFWTRPMTDGGLLCWLNPDCWQDNPNLTVGALASEISIAVLATSVSD